MRNVLLASVAAGLLFLCAGDPSARGDMGTVVFVPTVRVFEPNQRALIAWNGREEILILSTDLKVSKATKVLEVMPFPSKPTVKAGETKTFERAIKLINAAQKPRLEAVGSTGLFGGEGGKAKQVWVTPPPAEIVFHKKIGATDVNVIHVLKQDGFIDWVEKYLRKQGVKEVVIPDIMKKSVAEYLEDGCQWFAFNVLSLGEEVRTKEAVEYRFASDCLYYPLRISRTNEGQTKVSLLVLTRSMFDAGQFAGLPQAKLRVDGDPAEVSANQLVYLHRESAKLLGGRSSAMLRVWTLSGELGSFDQDLVVGRPPRFALADPTSGKTLGPVELKQGAKIAIGNETFAVETSSPSFFRLVGKNHFTAIHSFEDGARVKVVKDFYTLRILRPPIGTPAEK